MDVGISQHFNKKPIGQLRLSDLPDDKRMQLQEWFNEADVLFGEYKNEWTYGHLSFELNEDGDLVQIYTYEI